MATGRQFSPTIQVLTSIFKGLREIQSILGETTQYITFPIHFLVVGLQKKLAPIEQPLAISTQLGWTNMLIKS